MASAACRSASESGPSARAMRITSARYHSLAWMVSCAAHLVQGRANRLERLHEVGIEHGLVVIRHAGTDDRLDRPLPRHRAGRIARPQHGRDGGPHAGRQRRLHLRRGRLAEHLRHVAGPAGGALDVLADRVQRDDREEEQREPPAPRPVPVLPVPAATTAMEGALRDRPVEHAQAEDDQQRGSPSAYRPTHSRQAPRRRRAPSPLSVQVNPSCRRRPSRRRCRCRSDTTFSAEPGALSADSAAPGAAGTGGSS